MTLSDEVTAGSLDDLLLRHDAADLVYRDAEEDHVSQTDTLQSALPAPSAHSSSASSTRCWAGLTGIAGVSFAVARIIAATFLVLFLFLIAMFMLAV